MLSSQRWFTDAGAIILKPHAHTRTQIDFVLYETHPDNDHYKIIINRMQIKHEHAPNVPVRPTFSSANTAANVQRMLNKHNRLHAAGFI